MALHLSGTTSPAGLSEQVMRSSRAPVSDETDTSFVISNFIKD